jgi:hypothetical protein
MKNWKVFGIIALAVIITFAFIACDDNGGGSKKETKVAMPTPNRTAGTHPYGTEVTLATTTSGAEIWYTIDGTTPAKDGTTSTKYTAPIKLGNFTLKAIGVKAGLDDSDILEVIYTVTYTVQSVIPITGFKGVEGTTSYGTAIAPNGDAGYYFNDRAPADAMVEFQLGQSFDRTEWDFLLFDIAADTFNNFDWLAGIYTRLRYSVTENWEGLRLENNSIMRTAIDSIRGVVPFESQWVTVKIPISQRAGWGLHDGGGNLSTTLVDNIQIMFPFRGGDYDDANKDPSAKLYFRNFRLEEREGGDEGPKGDQGNPDNLTVESVLEIKGFKTENNTGTFGIIRAPNNDPACFVSDRAPQDTVVEFRLEAFDRTKWDYLLFDMTADTFEKFDWVAGIYPRLRYSVDSNWQGIRFENNPIMRAAIDSIREETFESQWVTIKIPISQRAGWNLHDGGGNLSTTLVDDIQIMFPFRGGDYDEAKKDPSAKLYFRNFRLEGEIVNDGTVPFIVNSWYSGNDHFIKGPDTDGVYTVQDNWQAAMTHQWGEIQFFRPGGDVDALGTTHFVFDMRADERDVGGSMFLDIQNLNVMIRTVDGPGNWIVFNRDNVRGVFGDAGWPVNQWVSIVIPVTEDKIAAQDGADYDNVLGNVRAVFIGIESTNEIPDPGYREKNLYFRNFRFETRD